MPANKAGMGFAQQPPDELHSALPGWFPAPLGGPSWFSVLGPCLRAEVAMPRTAEVMLGSLPRLQPITPAGMWTRGKATLTRPAEMKTEIAVFGPPPVLMSDV